MWIYREIKIETKKQSNATVGDVPDYEIGARETGDKSKSFEVLKFVYSGVAKGGGGWRSGL